MDDEILQEFLAESWENLGQLDTAIVTLEKEPANADLLASIFHTIHTINGTCGFIGLIELGGVAHSAENVLGKMRDGLLEVTPESVSLILRAIDVIKELLQGIEATYEEPACDNSALIAELDHLAEFGTSMRDDSEAGPPVESPALPESSVTDSEMPIADVASAESGFVASMDAASTEAAAAPASAVEVTPVDVSQAGPPVVESFTTDAPAVSAPPEPSPSAEASPAAIPKPETDTEPVAESNRVDSDRESVSESSIRVHVDVPDSLTYLVGELVLARNQLLQLARGDDDSKYTAAITDLNRVITNLQNGVMKTRMQPIGIVWSKLSRLVRDLVEKTGRRIELEMSGAETELDRTALDAINDPLTHLVRNAADHSIESPEVRSANGKPEFGTIRLNAYHEDGHVIISMEDDGAGINATRVKRKAIEQGLLTESEAETLTHNEIVSLVFRPGFSTAETVSSVSGRGVGMDAVRTQIERIGGTIDMTSTDGVGTNIRIDIPLTLAIISALVVESGGELFAIPQSGVVERVRLAAEDRDRIEIIHENEVFRLRDRLLPLVHLNQALGLPAADGDEAQDINIVVVHAGDQQLGLIVSEVFDAEEIVVQPVGCERKDPAIYQGTTTLGDGRVIMILNVAGVADRFRPHDHGRHDVGDASDSDSSGEVTSLLLFNSGEGTTMSVPLSLVARLEEFPRSSIEKTADNDVVQYRGDLLPILPVNDLVASDGPLPDPQPVIVFSEGDKSMGLVVNEIQDIIEERLVIRMRSQRPGILGTAIINGKATDVIDTQHYVIKANPEWFQRSDKEQPRRVLLIDDSMFFRQLVTTTLETQHTEVHTAKSAVEAVERLERGEHFDVVISDIEMPAMDGYAFAEWFRSRPESSQIPLIALTSLSAESTETRALKAGFDRLLTKFVAQKLIDCLNELCRMSKTPVEASA